MLAREETKGRRGTKAEERIDARMPRDTKRIIEQAANLIGVTVSDFVINQAYQAAQTVIKDHDRWVLNRIQSEAFADSLLHPPEPNLALRQAAVRSKST